LTVANDQLKKARSNLIVKALLSKVSAQEKPIAQTPIEE